MPKIKMYTTSAGPEGYCQAGQVREADKKEAKALVDGGYAEYVTADAPPADKAQADKGDIADAPTQENADAK